MLKHVKSFITYYCWHQPVCFVSHHDLSESSSRILSLNQRGEVIAQKVNSAEFILFARAHANGATCKGGMPITPILTGKLSQESGSTVLKGQLAIHGLVKLGVGFMSFILFIFFWDPMASYLGGKVRETFFGARLFAIAFFFLLLEVGYFNGKKDVETISRNIRRALNCDP